MDPERRRRVRPGLERFVSTVQAPHRSLVFFDVEYTPSRVAAARSSRHYEFPTGYNHYFGSERYTVGELFFNHPPHLQVRSSSCLFALRVYANGQRLVFFYFTGVKSKHAKNHPGAYRVVNQLVRPRPSPSAPQQCRSRRRRQFIRRIRRSVEQRAQPEFRSCQFPPPPLVHYTLQIACCF
jgi:Actin